ncbi:MAG: hypothetical protein IJ325_00895 [Clostridia bacterium]|nr:hypothetical protein [Clostridia bacterium]
MPHNTMSKHILSRHTTSFLTDAELYYELIEEVLPDNRITYALFVRLSYSDGKQKECLVQDITSDKDLATVLYHKILCGSVTPCTLTEVLSDLLAEY